MYNSQLEGTILEHMIDDDIREFESYDRTLLDSVIETNDVDIESYSDISDDDITGEDYDDFFEDDFDDFDDDDNIDSLITDCEDSEVFDQYSSTYRKYY